MHDLQQLSAVAQAAILGVLQGLSEFLPISSSAHLVILPQLMGWPYLGKAFDVALHFGTLLALLMALRSEVDSLLRGAGALFPGTPQALPHEIQLARLVALGSIPVAVLGLLFESAIEAHLGGLSTVACSLILGGIFLFWVEQDRKEQGRELHQLTVRDALLIGAAQALALIPGISRSGATVTAALALKLHRAEAAKFSFLLSLPVVAGATLHKSFKLGWPPGSSELLLPVVVGVACAWVSGYLCLKSFLSYLQRASFAPFAAYRIILGSILLLFFAR